MGAHKTFGGDGLILETKMCYTRYILILHTIKLYIIACSTPRTHIWGDDTSLPLENNNICSCLMCFCGVSFLYCLYISIVLIVSYV